MKIVHFFKSQKRDTIKKEKLIRKLWIQKEGNFC